MKFLSVPRLQRLSSLLSHVDLGDVIVHARVEAYSCKPAGDDKRVGKQIERQLSSELAHSPHLSPSMSPLGPLTDIHTRKLLISLITTMNASFPDYDFSNLRAEQFDRELSPHTAVTQLNSLFLSALDSQQPGLRDEFWAAVGETVDLVGCELYRYMPGTDSDIDEGALWSIHYFFFHRKEKKVVFVSASAQSKLHDDDHAEEEEENEVDVVMSSSGNDWDEGEAEANGGEVSGSILWDQLEYGQATREQLARRQDEQSGPSTVSVVKEVTEDSATLPKAAMSGRRKARGSKRDTASSTDSAADSKPRRKRKQRGTSTPKAQATATTDKRSRRTAKLTSASTTHSSLASADQPPATTPAILRADSDPEVGGRSLLDVRAASPSTSPLTVGGGILAMVEGQQQQQQQDKKKE